MEIISVSGQGLTVALGPVGSSLHWHSGIWDLQQGQTLAKQGSLSQEITSFRDVLDCTLKPTTTQSSNSVREWSWNYGKALFRVHVGRLHFSS